MHRASVEKNGSLSEDSFWPDSDESNEDYWDEVCSTVDSVTNSPIRDPPITSFMTRMTDRKIRSQDIRNVFSQPAEYCSPTKPCHPDSQMDLGTALSTKKNGKKPMQSQDHELSEDEVAAVVTDTEPSPASSHQSTQFFVHSRATSMSSIQSNHSSSSNSSGRKRRAELRKSPPPLTAHTRSSPVEITDIFTATSGQTNSPLFSGAHRLPSLKRHGGNVVPAEVYPEPSTSSSNAVPCDSVAAVAPGPSPRSDSIVVVPNSMPSSSPAAPRGPFGVDLDPFIIAHDAKVQHDIDQLHLSWGVQYELARGISTGAWSWSDITPEILNQLKGPDSESAHKVAGIKPGSKVKDMTYTDFSIWKELEREQKAIMENRQRGVGLLDDGEWDGVANWYGGQVQQLARLAKDKGTQYVVRLEPLEKRRSNRFARFLGSRRILQLRIPTEFMMKDGSKIVELLLCKFILCGRVFVAFHSKEEGLYLVETNENWERQSDLRCGDQYRMAFDQFVEWHNPLRFNERQPMSKWSTRFALGLSTSVPAIEFEGKNMFLINDLLAEDWQGDEKPPAEKIMTDGCGFINGAALRLIYLRFKYRNSPVAVQGRVAGAKGLWVLHPTDQEPDAPPRIWIRESQKKIVLPPFTELDRPRRIFDLVGPARVSMPYHLSMQSILNLSHNGVGNQVFVNLMADRLNEEVKQLTDWTRPNAMVFTWDAINRAGHVAGVRAQRQSNGTSRALGLSGRDYSTHNDTVEMDSPELEETESSLNTGRCRFSGAPLSLYESAMELIQAGFDPLECKLLRNKLKSILKLVIDAAVNKYHSPIPQSAEAFIVPDPSGVLKEGEIYFRSSQPLNDPVSGRYFDTLEGPVIVGRNPIRVPSDMQKVVAVNNPELSTYYDVAIFSTKGSRSLQSLLSGGDITLMIWDPSFLEPFSNATYISPPDNFLSQNFEKQVEKVEDFGHRYRGLSAPEAQKAFQTVLLLGLADLKIGLWSNFHDVAVYLLGYGSDKARHQAHMFETALDSAKTGLRVKDEVFKAAKRLFDHPRPKCMAPSSQTSSIGRFLPPRDRSLGRFVLDDLMEAGAAQSTLHYKKYDELDGVAVVADKDLLQPYKVAQDRAISSQKAGFNGFQTELDLIKKRIEELHQRWQALPMKQSKSSPTKKPGNQRKGNTDYDALAQQFAEHLPGIEFTVDVDKVKASFAYQCGETFGFRMAFKDLCAIKAHAKGNTPLLQSFSDVMTVSSSALRALAHNHDDF